MSAGRSHFRVEDLLRLATLIAQQNAGAATKTATATTSTIKLVRPQGCEDLAQMAVATREPVPMGSVQQPPKAAPSASSSDRPPPHRCERISPVKNRMLEIGTSGTVRGEDGNILTYVINSDKVFRYTQPRWVDHILLIAPNGPAIVSRRSDKTPAVPSPRPGRFDASGSGPRPQVLVWPGSPL